MLVSLFVLPALVPIAVVMWCAWWLVASLGDQLHPANLPVPVRLSRPVSAGMPRPGEGQSKSSHGLRFGKVRIQSGSHLGLGQYVCLVAEMRESLLPRHLSAPPVNGDLRAALGCRVD